MKSGILLSVFPPPAMGLNILIRKRGKGKYWQVHLGLRTRIPSRRGTSSDTHAGRSGARPLKAWPPMLRGPLGGRPPRKASYVTRTQTLPYPFSPQAEKGRGQARGPRSRRRCCLSHLQVAALGSRPLRQLCSHSVLGSSPLFHVSRKSSWAAGGRGPGLLSLDRLRIGC